MRTIEDILWEGKTDYSLPLTEENKPVLTSFLAWALEKTGYLHSEKEYVKKESSIVSRWAVDAAILFCCLHGYKPVKVSIYSNAETIIDTLDKLPLLRSRGSQKEQWPDSFLYHLYLRRESAATHHGLLGYKQTLSLLGRYPPLHKRWGVELIYEKYIGIRAGK